MKTVLCGRTKEVIIDTNGPVIIIGESINPTRRKKLVSTLQEGNFETLFALSFMSEDFSQGSFFDRYWQPQN